MWVQKIIYHGTMIVIVKEEILGKSGRVIPSILIMKTYQSRKHVQYTCCISSLCSLLTLQWLKNLGGVAVIEKLNNAKAALLYAEIDRNPLFKAAALKIVLL
jgi:phosphoserine aminotransferase